MNKFARDRSAKFLPWGKESISFFLCFAMAHKFTSMN
jgi:hypothetical protein